MTQREALEHLCILSSLVLYRSKERNKINHCSLSSQV
jgi:hypothetical protein